jgi:hypothetical protein
VRQEQGGEGLVLVSFNEDRFIPSIFSYLMDLIQKDCLSDSSEAH